MAHYARKFLLVCYLSAMFSNASAQLESWSGWAELDSDQQIALLDEISEWLDRPLQLRSLTWSNLNDLPISATARDRIWGIIKNTPNPSLQNLLDSLDASGWDYAVLSAVVTEKKIPPTQQYRLRILNGAGKNDQQFRQTLSAKVNQFQVAGLAQRQAGDDSFLKTFSGGLLYQSEDAKSRLYAGNYRLDIGLGLAVRQSTFVSGNSLSQILPRIRQRVKLHQSAQNYGYFKGFAFQKNWSEDALQFLAFLSRISIPGKLEDGIFHPYPASLAENLVYRTETTIGTSLIYRRDKNTMVQVGLTADELASKWIFPVEFDLTHTRGHLTLTYGSGWSGGDTLTQIAGLQLNGKHISGAVSFWHLGWIGKSVYRLSAPISAMENENSQGASMGFRLQIQPALTLDITSWFRKPMIALDLESDGWKQGISLRLTNPKVIVFWSSQRSESVIETQKFSFQFNQRPDKHLVLNEVLKVTNAGELMGGLAGLRVQYKLDDWQAAFGLARYIAENYAVRQYAYESDVINAFSIPLYYGNGVRMYVTGRFSDSFWSMEFKCGQWRQFSAESTLNKFDATLQLSIVL